MKYQAKFGIMLGGKPRGTTGEILERTDIMEEECFGMFFQDLESF